MADKRGSKGKRREGGKWAIDQRLVKALTHELRVEILGVLNERISSPNQLAQELGEPLGNVSYHVKTLLEYDCIELVKTEQRRGAIEHYYRATSRAFLTDRDWQQLPDSIRPGMSADLLKLIVGDAASGLQEGTLDARKDRHMSRTLLIVDERGWKDLIDVLKRTRSQIDQIQSKSSSRLAKSGEDGFTVSASLLGFETPESRGDGPRQGKKAKGNGGSKKGR